MFFDQRAYTQRGPTCKLTDGMGRCYDGYPNNFPSPRPGSSQPHEHTALLFDNSGRLRSLTIFPP